MAILLYKFREWNDKFLLKRSEHASSWNLWHLTLDLMKVSDDRTINEWSMKSTIKAEIVMRRKTERRRYIWEIWIMCRVHAEIWQAIKGWSETATVLNKRVKILNAMRSFEQRRNLIRDVAMRVFLWIIF